MASNNSVLNIIIRARDLAKGTLNKITRSIRRVGDTSEEVGEQHNAAMSESASITSALAGHYNTLNAELQGMSSAAREAFEKMQGATHIDTTEAQGSVAALKEELKATNEELSRLKSSQYSLLLVPMLCVGTRVLRQPPSRE